MMPDVDASIGECGAADLKRSAKNTDARSKRGAMCALIPSAPGALFAGSRADRNGLRGANSAMFSG